MGILEGLKALRTPSNVTYYIDSEYIISATRHGDAWLTSEGRANRDLWIQIIQTAKKGGHKIKFIKVKAHSGNRLNELADRLAKAECIKAKHLLIKR